MVVNFILSAFAIFAIWAFWIAIARFYGSESLSGEYEDEEFWTPPEPSIQRHAGNSHQRRIARRKLARAQKLGKA